MGSPFVRFANRNAFAGELVEPTKILYFGAHNGPCSCSAENERCRHALDRSGDWCICSCHWGEPPVAPTFRQTMDTIKMGGVATAFDGLGKGNWGKVGVGFAVAGLTILVERELEKLARAEAERSRIQQEAV